MNKYKKVYEDIMSGDRDSSINFNDAIALIKRLGAVSRIKGDHFIFCFTDFPGIINLQPKNGKVKSYQVRQLRYYFKEHGITYEGRDSDV